MPAGGMSDGEPAWIGANRCYGTLFRDPEIAARFGTAATLDAMLRFERELTRALIAAGAVDRAAGEAALAAMERFEPDVAAIATAAGVDGLPAPELVRQLKASVLAEAGEGALAAVHVGATSQDLLDTGLALALRATSDVLAARLADLIDALDRARARAGNAALMGRTRMRAALPITAADRLHAWTDPLRRHLERLRQLRPRVEIVQYAGPVGRRDKPNGDDVMRRLAEALDLHPSPRSWQATRDGVVEYGAWLALVAGSLGKIGQDVALMAQDGVDAIALSGGGSSSAMPHKRNPVLAEHLVALARFAAGQSAVLGQAVVHEQERSGSAWTLEWMTLPLLAETCGAATLHAHRLVRSIERIGTAAPDAEPENGAWTGGGGGT